MRDSSVVENHIELWRIIIFAIGIAAMFLLYVVRLFDWQILQYETFFAQAEENRIQTINLPAQRGIIYDRNGVTLARNIPSYNIVITQAYMPDDEGAVDDIVRELSNLTNIPVNLNEISEENPFVPCVSDHGIAQIVEYGEVSAPYQSVPVACDVSREIALIVQEKSTLWPGVSVQTSSLRDYPTGILTANIIGFLGPIPAEQELFYVEQGFIPNRDKIGYAGIEDYFQEELGGTNGSRQVSRDVAGQLFQDIVPPIEPIPGNNLRLTLDTRLQQATTAIIEDELTYWNQRAGRMVMTSAVAIAINPKTGEILAMVSYPSYENNRMARFIPAYYYRQLLEDSREPLRNHAVYAELPAGSVFKLVTALGALNEGVVEPETIIQTPGKLVLEEKSFYVNVPNSTRDYVDWVYKTRGIEGFGELDMIGAIGNSSNVYFYKMGGGWEDEVDPGLGICRLGTYARALGYGNFPAIELPDKADGLIPDPDWKRIIQGESWTVGDTFIMSVGQGYALATPLQVLMSAATIANDGKLMEPTLLREILDGEGNVVQPFEPSMRWDLTINPVIEAYAENSTRGCQLTGEKKTVEPWVFDIIQQGMREAVVNGTLKDIFAGVEIAAAGKTGTAEYCDKYAAQKDLCVPGSWPTHAWTVAYAPYDDPEIAVVAFVYNGNEGATVAGPIVRRVIESYFALKVAESPSGGGIVVP
jgi:penicillin-binding protein 2